MAARNSLVLYKGRPALVRGVGSKLEIELEGGESVQVRPKDVVLLHPGPMQTLSQLQPVRGEVEAAWELLAGSTTSLAELAELAFGVYSPATAWATWKLVADGLYFRGSPEAVVARTPLDVDTERASRNRQANEEQAKAAFLGRLRARRVLPEDRPLLREVEELALGKRTGSRVLRELGQTESPEAAHALLLELGIWDPSENPYPRRLGAAITFPVADLPELTGETRADLTHLAAFAIDDEGNLEPDDALSLDGNRLWVHVADAAALVRPGSPADVEAQARGASLYLPEGSVPMLPPAAIQLLGLGLAEVSPALSFGLDLNEEGQVQALEVVPSWVRVSRVTYEQADARLEEEPFRGLYRAARRFQEHRRAHGAVWIELPEVRIRVAEGKVLIDPIPSLRSREMVTEAMLMTGQAVAQMAIERGLGIPFTVQAPPRSDERARSPSPAASGGLAGMYALRRASQPSQPSTAPGPHAGLGLATYAQATSPLRRYLDLVVHQQLRAYLRGEPPLGAAEVLQRIGATMAASAVTRQAERLSRRHWTLVYLLNQTGAAMQGVLVEKQGKRGTVLIPELDLDVQVHLQRDLPLNSDIELAPGAVDLARLTAHVQAGR